MTIELSRKDKVLIAELLANDAAMWLQAAESPLAKGDGPVYRGRALVRVQLAERFMTDIRLEQNQKLVDKFTPPAPPIIIEDD